MCLFETKIYNFKTIFFEHFNKKANKTAIKLIGLSVLVLNKCI